MSKGHHGREATDSTALRGHLSVEGGDAHFDLKMF